ncbi:hypothetical protein ACS0TY_035193 [Phlomoides rotata]
MFIKLTYDEPCYMKDSAMLRAAFDSLGRELRNREEKHSYLLILKVIYKEWVEFLGDIESEGYPSASSVPHLKLPRASKKGKQNKKASTKSKSLKRQKVISLSPILADVMKPSGEGATRRKHRQFLSRRKRKLVKDLIANTKADFVCIQETKLDIITTTVCESLWVDKNFDWVYSGFTGSAGGLLCIWDKRKFVRDDCCSDEGFLSVSGFWESSKDFLRIVNIYAPCDFGKKMVLWEKVSIMTQENPEAYWCVCGDFNSILHTSERKGLNRSSQSRDIALFNSFVRDSGLYDLPLLRRRFTWYKDNGTCCSRLDRFLVSKAWIAKWLNLKQVGLKRTISDRAPVSLEMEQIINWGMGIFCGQGEAEDLKAGN